MPLWQFYGPSHTREDSLMQSTLKKYLTFGEMVVHLCKQLDPPFVQAGKSRLVLKSEAP